MFTHPWRCQNWESRGADPGLQHYLCMSNIVKPVLFLVDWGPVCMDIINSLRIWIYELFSWKNMCVCVFSALFQPQSGKIWRHLWVLQYSSIVHVYIVLLDIISITVYRINYNTINPFACICLMYFCFALVA